MLEHAPLYNKNGQKQAVQVVSLHTEQLAWMQVMQVLDGEVYVAKGQLL